MSANTDLLKKLSRKWVSQIGAAGVSDAVVTTIPLSSTTNLATDTAVVATIDRVDSNGTKTPTLEESVIGVVSGSNLVDCTRGVEGTAQAHSAGSVVEILVTAKGYNDIIDHLLVEHNQLGTHKKATGATINTGTDNATIVTPKAIADSDISTGWTPARETWTYASASTITVPAGAASKYGKGDRIKWTQTTVKYGVIVAVADTLLTIAVNTDYVVTDAAITLNYYSHQVNPIGYPDWFTTTIPVFNVANFDDGSGAQPATTRSRFKIIGKQVFVDYAGSGVKAGTNTLILITSHSFPVVSSATALNGHALVYPGSYPVLIGGITDKLLSINLNASITDNTTCSNLAFLASYEI